MSHDGPSWIYRELVVPPFFFIHQHGGGDAYNLVQALRSTQASWACTDDENVNRTVWIEQLSVTTIQTQSAMVVGR